MKKIILTLAIMVVSFLGAGNLSVAAPLDKFPITILSDKTVDGAREIVVKPSGVCSRQIYVKAKDGVILGVKFTGGCDGNAQGIEKLVEGMTVKDAIKKIEGIDCAGRGTSCPDQLSKALRVLDGSKKK